MNRKRAERLLEWWADCMVNGRERGGFGSESVEFKMVSGGGFVYGSRPLMGGTMCDTDQRIDRLIKANMSPLGRVRAIAVFCPFDKSVRLTMGDRARIAKCSLSACERSKRESLGIVMANWKMLKE